MNQTQAISRLRKVLGPKIAYRIDLNALGADDREAALIKAREVAEKKAKVEEQMKARRAELLRDPAYQALRQEYEALGKEHDKFAHASHAKRITVGIDRGLFFSVRADGDNWDDVVAKVTGTAS